MTFRSVGARPSIGVRQTARSAATWVALASEKEISWPLNSFDTISSIAPSRT